MSTSDQKGPAELVPPDQSVIAYAIGEFTVYRDLYPLSDAGKASVRAIIETLRGINGADSKKAVGEAVDSVAEQWVMEDCLSPAPAVSPPSASPSTAVEVANDYQDVCAEIERREAWLSKMREAQAEIEELLGEVEGLIQRNAEKMQYGGEEDVAGARKTASTLASRRHHIEAARDSFAALPETVKGDLERLKQYKRALDIVRAGCPPDLLGATLPLIPPFTAEDGGQPEEVRSVVLPGSPSGAPSTSSCSAALSAIAQKSGMSEAEVLIYSLYDLFGTDNKWLRNGSGKPLHRGVRRVITAALVELPELRWETPHQVYDEMVKSGGRLTESGYLVYRGTPPQGGMPSFVRSDKTLPWSTSPLFPDEVRAKIVAEVM